MNENATVRQQQLAEALVKLRGGLTSADVFAATGISASKLSRIENCFVRAKPNDVRTLARFYNVDEDTVNKLVRAAEEAANPPVLRDYTGKGWDVALRSHLELECNAREIRSWTIDLVPGLLQIPETTRAHILSRPDVDPSTVDDRLEFRYRRQERVRTGDLKLRAIIGEAVLHTPTGGPLVLADQLDYLAAEADHIEVQVLPFAVGAHAGQGSSFHLFDFATSSRIVYQDTIKQGLYQDDEETVIAHAKILDRLSELALPIEQSRELLTTTATTLRIQARKEFPGEQ